MATQVRVAVRVRPLTSKEHAQGGKQVVEARPPSVGIGTRSFTYDQVFDATVSQSSLYQRVSPSLLSSFLEGYNATIMAYGQTGSGKTFTMGSEAHSEGEAGLITRFMTQIFDSLSKKKEEPDESGPTLVDFHVQASFLEVYGEDVHDLLDQDRKPLPMRDDANGGVVVSGLTSKAIASAEEALEILHVGTLNRTTAATLMNLTSSRSHAIFTIYLTQTTRAEEVDVTTTSKFTFVDLAGSERMKKTGAEGERALEGIKINQGLLALGNVINALADEERLAKEKKVHVPYRQSKLTRLLQDALGGNSQTLFIACVSPADTNSSETLSTLHYANRARNIKNAPTKNVDGASVELQRLQSLNTVLLSELIKARFGENELVEQLMNKQDVKDYLEGLQAKVEDNVKLPALLPPPSATLPPLCAFTPTKTPGRRATVMTPRTGMKDNILDETMLEEVNPEEELAILDQLLELQSQDQEFNKQHKEGQAEIKQVQGELEEQEALLLQLRDSLKVYHSMKEKYQVLMAEVGQLEMEKTSLADQLEKAAADPTKGCSLAIKRKLEKVEASLVRARSDTRKHQQRYREAEQQAQKCRALERKIEQLKHNKVAMIKKQKEATTRHREFTEAKTREVLVLKKKVRTDGKKVTKLQSEVQLHRNQLVKRKHYTEKLSEKLKETESHLMKLLTMRQRELKRRTVSPSRRQSIRKPLKDAGFANDKSQEMDSMKFFLNRLVADRVSLEQSRLQYEERVSEYSEIMRKLVQEVRVLDELKDHDDVQEEVVAEHEQAVENLELKLEIISGELDDLRRRVGSPEDESIMSSKIEKKAKETVGSLNAKGARLLLWEFVDKFAGSELERQQQSKSIEQKDSVIESFEAEVRSLTQKVSTLTTDIAERRQLALGKLDPIDTVRDLQRQISELSSKYEQSQADIRDNEKETVGFKKKCAAAQLELLETKEKLALSETILRQREDAHDSERTMEVLQAIWRKVGVPGEERDRVRLSLMSCLDDTCKRLVSDARDLKRSTESEIQKIRHSLATANEALGATTKIDLGFSGPRTLFEERDSLQAMLDVVKPEYDEAIRRRGQIIEGANRVMQSMGLHEANLSENLRELILAAKQTGVPPESKVHQSAQKKRAAMMKDVEGMLQALEECTEMEESGDSQSNNVSSLESRFLDRCEKDLSDLRMAKSRKAVANSGKQTEAHNLLMDMHLNAEDIDSLIMSCSTHPIPSWWQQETSRKVANVILEENGIVEVFDSFTKHLDHMHAVITTVSEERKQLSSALKEAIDRAQRTLLLTVGEEVDASEAYASFHDALFNLPPLSKEHVQTCIEEISALTTGVEAMTQSEIEALSVIWEALHVGTKDRGSFWSEIEDQSKVLLSNKSAFDSFDAGADEWATTASEEASKAYRLLNLRLHKLEQVHTEVERLRSKQDAKSRIISLDSEIRILSATLAEFEEKKCNKERLLTKKAGSSTLLREERFRKQMQTKFSTKLSELTTAVKSWKESDGNTFDEDLLSEEVRMLLNNPDKMATLVEKRTAFMHLRTVQSKSAGASSSKRTAPYAVPQESPAKRQKPSAKSSGKLPSDSLSSGGSSRNTPGMPRPLRSTRSRVGTENIPVTSSASSSNRKRSKNSSRSRSPMKPKVRRRNEDSKEKVQPLAAIASKSSRGSKSSFEKSKRETMTPFGHLLDVQSPDTKENAR